MCPLAHGEVVFHNVFSPPKQTLVTQELQFRKTKLATERLRASMHAMLHALDTTKYAMATLYHGQGNNPMPGPRHLPRECTSHMRTTSTRDIQSITTMHTASAPRTPASTCPYSCSLQKVLQVYLQVVTHTPLATPRQICRRCHENLLRWSQTIRPNLPWGTTKLPSGILSVVHDILGAKCSVGRTLFAPPT